jgi:adenosylcobyric acid synthase
MLQGTASSVGKSLLVAALGRVFARRGVSVAPFKAQNLALNADVTPDGREIGRAQSLQARACMVLPEVDMNPILLKPEPDGMQVVVLGESRGRAAARGSYEHALELGQVVTGALERLRRRFDVVVIEGAGSPAEINLQERDLANMFVARAAGAPVLLVGDIERGGVFAQLIGTLHLLDPADRARVHGLLINKFHGDPAHFGSGRAQLEALAGVPVMGVIPYVDALRLPDEDWQSTAQRSRGHRATAGELEIAIIALPFASNIDDFDALAWETGVVTRFATHPAELEGADLVIVPGTKATLGDLAWLRATGFEPALRARASRGEPVLGICGGCQMLGRTIIDHDGVEAEPGARSQGLGLLPIETHFQAPKRTARVELRSQSAASPFGRFEGASGYWIHAGRVRRIGGPPALEARGAGAEASWHGDGAFALHHATDAAVVIGTMVHGVLANPIPRRNLLRDLALRRGRCWTAGPPIPSVEEQLDHLADAFEQSADMAAIEHLLDAAD